MRRCTVVGIYYKGLSIEAVRDGTRRGADTVVAMGCTGHMQMQQAANFCLARLSSQIADPCIDDCWQDSTPVHVAANAWTSCTFVVGRHGETTATDPNH